MGDNSGIEWTDATMVDRGGRRVRVYRRQDPRRPGQQLRRQMAAKGLRWCRGCCLWLRSALISQGACRVCLNAEYRAHYRRNPRIKAQKVARRRGTDPVPPDADFVAELFGYSCAYCGGPQQSWDHVIPVVRGGRSEAGNIVPACVSCNSSKGSRDVYVWSDGRPVHPYLFEYLTMVEAA